MATDKATIRNTDDVRQLGTILGVWAHPDDESFSCGGIMAAAVHNGQTVACVTATKGEAGVQDAKRWPPEHLADIRAAEMASALKALGISNHHWLNYPDGGCPEINNDEAVAEILKLIERYQPDTILTFGPDGMTGHPDHQTMSRWAHQAVKRAGRNVAIYHAVQSQRLYDLYLKAADEQFDIFFNIDEPPLRDEDHCDICFRLSPELIEQKFQALKAMPSQTEAMLTQTPADQLAESFAVECFEHADAG